MTFTFVRRACARREGGGLLVASAEKGALGKVAKDCRVRHYVVGHTDRNKVSAAVFPVM